MASHLSYVNGVDVDPLAFNMTQAKLRDEFINYTRKAYTLLSIDHLRIDERIQNIIRNMVLRE